MMHLRCYLWVILCKSCAEKYGMSKKISGWVAKPTNQLVWDFNPSTPLD